MENVIFGTDTSKCIYFAAVFSEIILFLRTVQSSHTIRNKNSFKSSLGIYFLPCLPKYVPNLYAGILQKLSLLFKCLVYSDLVALMKMEIFQSIYFPCTNKYQLMHYWNVYIKTCTSPYTYVSTTKSSTAWGRSLV